MSLDADGFAQAVLDTDRLKEHVARSIGDVPRKERELANAPLSGLS